MALYDKVISILSIPDQNTNDSIVNATNLYDEWKNGDGQLLLPLILIFIVFFCCFCALLQVTIWFVFLCVKSIIGNNEEEEDFNISKRDTSSSEKSQKSGKLFHMGSQAESTENGTPRSRKSNISSQNGTNSV